MFFDDWNLCVSKTSMTKDLKRIEFQLAFGQVTLQYFMIWLANDLADPVAIGKVRMKKLLAKQENILVLYDRTALFRANCAELFYPHKELTISYLDPALFCLRLIPKITYTKWKAILLKYKQV